MRSKGQKVKHSKIRNTGIIFECLLRQVTADVISGKKKSEALSILKRQFNEHTEIGKEIVLYTTLLNEKFDSDKKADYLISETLKEYSKLNKKQIKKDKYNVIKELKEHYNISEFLSSKIPNYRVYASIYKLFEMNQHMKPEEKTETYFNILENITTKENTLTLSSLSEDNKKDDKDLRILAYKVLLEKFNKKYSNLDFNQRKLLRIYINNISNTNSLREHIESEMPKLKTQLKKYSKNVENKIVKIKLKEAVNSVEKLCEMKNSNVKDKVVVTLLRYYELLNELKSVKK